jgi:DNA repair protein RecO (recombination protein O)
VPRKARAHRERIRTEALLLRAAPFGEADVMTTLLTEQRGIISAVARGARRSLHRFPALEPMHLLRVGLEERSTEDIATLVESSIERARLGLVDSLRQLEAAGLLLRWVRRAVSPNTREPAVWSETNDALDALETAPPGREDVFVASAGLRLLAAVGWGIELERCVRCGKPCDEDASAYMDPAEGGLVCRACGGGPVLLRAVRRRALIAASLGGVDAMAPEDARFAIDLVEAILSAHGTR